MVCADGTAPDRTVRGMAERRRRVLGTPQCPLTPQEFWNTRHLCLCLSASVRHYFSSELRQETCLLPFASNFCLGFWFSAGLVVSMLMCPPPADSCDRGPHAQGAHPLSLAFADTAPSWSCGGPSLWQAGGAPAHRSSGSCGAAVPTVP